MTTPKGGRTPGVGTWARGSGHGRAILTEIEVLVIRELAAAGRLTQKQIADRYRVGRSTITSIVSRRSWQHLPEES